MKAKAPIRLNVSYQVTLSDEECHWLLRHAQLTNVAGSTVGELLSNLFQSQGTERLLFSHEARQAHLGEYEP